MALERPQNGILHIFASPAQKLLQRLLQEIVAFAVLPIGLRRESIFRHDHDLCDGRDGQHHTPLRLDRLAARLQCHDVERQPLVKGRCRGQKGGASETL